MLFSIIYTKNVSNSVWHVPVFRRTVGLKNGKCQTEFDTPLGIYDRKLHLAFLLHFPNFWSQLYLHLPICPTSSNSNRLGIKFDRWHNVSYISFLFSLWVRQVHYPHVFMMQRPLISFFMEPKRRGAPTPKALLGEVSEVTLVN